VFIPLNPAFCALDFSYVEYPPSRRSCRMQCSNLSKFQFLKWNNTTWGLHRYWVFFAANASARFLGQMTVFVNNFEM